MSRRGVGGGGLSRFIKIHEKFPNNCNTQSKHNFDGDGGMWVRGGGDQTENNIITGN